MTREQRIAALHADVARRILVLDGAMGTEIQDHNLGEAAYRGGRFADHSHDLKGNHDILNLTAPDVIQEIHENYFRAGADIIATNTFNASSISQADYGTQDHVYDINRTGAQLARNAAEATMSAQSGRNCWVAGAIGPTNKTTSLSPDVNDPGFRAVTFDEIKDVYKGAVRGLIDGEADLLLIETIFDSLNAKACLFGIEELFEEIGLRIPVMISGTITDLSGRMLTGQTPEAFWHSVRHTKPFSIGLNCSLGAHEMRAYIAEISKVADTLVCAYPNAGLPNEFGQYDEEPDSTAEYLSEWAASGLVNIVGGCCGTTPAHISAIKAKVENLPPRPVPDVGVAMRLSGLEAFSVPA
ncbi:MAG: 5-methyltetrahydrofolate--homocysteine methyltransferase [Alphaproteobacteria bacterium]|jgi:5-methyltetrahydrofolate--homocysteine methyltransferase